MNSLNRLTNAIAVGLVLAGCFATASAQTNSFLTSPESIVINVPENGTAPTVPLQLSTTSLTGVQFQIQAATDTGQRWLQFFPATGTTPSEISVTADLTGLTTGSYTGVLTITGPGVSNSPMSVPVRLNYGSQFSVSPTSAAFTYQSGGPMPMSQSIAINSTGSTALQYTATPTTNTGGPWLLVSQSSGATPGNIVISANPMGLSPGSYIGRVTLTSTTTGASDLIIPVSLNINPNPTLTVLPSNGLNFAYQAGGTAPAAQTLTFSSNGAAVNYTLSPITSSGGPWLVLSSNSGTASQAQPQKVTVSPNVTGLAPGTYQGKISVAAPGTSNPSLDVPVTLLVSLNPLLVLGNAPQPFNYQLGGSNPATQTVQVSSSSTPFAFQATAATESGGQWLSVTPASATTPQTLTISANPQNLAPGTYKGTITVSSAGAGNSPRSFDVTLVVAATTMLNVNTSGLTFNFQTTTNQQPSPQVVNVTSTGAPLNFSVNATTSNCGNSWVSATPTTGTTAGYAIGQRQSYRNRTASDLYGHAGHHIAGRYEYGKCSAGAERQLRPPAERIPGHAQVRDAERRRSARARSNQPYEHGPEPGGTVHGICHHPIRRNQLARRWTGLGQHAEKPERFGQSYGSRYRLVSGDHHDYVAEPAGASPGSGDVYDRLERRRRGQPNQHRVSSTGGSCRAGAHNRERHQFERRVDL